MNNNATLFDNYMTLILLIMLSMGMLAGIANFFLDDSRSKAGTRDLIKYIVLGVVAALTVPLFLNMTSSNLLEFGRSRPNALFVFAGFCLIYVLLSRRLFAGLAQKLFHLGQKRESLSMTHTPRTTEDFYRAGLSGTDLEIMRAVALGGSVYENLSSLNSEGDTPSKEFVNDRLVFLRQLGLLELRANEKNILHMCLSSAGTQLLTEATNVRPAA